MTSGSEKRRRRKVITEPRKWCTGGSHSLIKSLTLHDSEGKEFPFIIDPETNLKLYST